MSITSIEQHQQIFSCPICNSNMKVVNSKSLVCVSNHTFDLAKSGYINFVTRPIAEDYSKTMLSHRKDVINAGFFQPLLEEILPILAAYKTPSYMLDAGCGEGTHLSWLSQHSGHFGVGIDLSKAGILLASKSAPNQVWAVADLAQTPFNDNTFSVITNILSPANYNEFNRILADNGTIIKVVPEKDYLKEIRQFFYKDDSRSQYSNQEVVNLFAERYPDYKAKQISYSFPVDPNLLSQIALMSPISWQVSENEIEKLKESEISSITASFTILTNK